VSIPIIYVRIWNFIKLTRVLFLLGGFLLYALGATAAARMGFTIHWTAYILGQVVVLAIQLMAQYLNEYHDIEVDRLTADNRTWFSGGSGMIATGKVSPGAVLTAARTCAIIAIVTGIFASVWSLWMIPIVLLSLAGSWFYSAPPISLVSTGWGELTTSLIVALMVPLAGFCMQGGFPPMVVGLACLPLVLIHAAMLISFEFPDRMADLAVGKKTLTVRLGLRGAAWVVDALIAIGFVFLGALALYVGVPVWQIAWVLPLAIWQMVMVHWVINSGKRFRFFILTTGGVVLFIIATQRGFAGFFFGG
jgi:1,4-dihydroxy-2-naphthoate octaprenyltransferase